MDKKILIGGGVGVIVIGGYLYMRAKNKAAVAAANADGQATAMTTTGDIPSYSSSVYSGLSPISGGTTSTDYSTTATDTTNSGSTSTGGGFDFTSLFSTLISSNAAHANAQTAADAATADSAILATILGGNSSVSVSHTGDSTTISAGDSVTNLIKDSYQQVLGRAPDAAGLAFYQNAIYNGNATVTDLQNSLKSSAEYKAAHPDTTAK